MSYGKFDPEEFARHPRWAGDVNPDEWYEAIADALQILGKRWFDDLTAEQDAFVLAYADEVATRPESER